MRFVPAICPQCGAQIQVDKDMERGFCGTCGTQILIADAVQRSKITVQYDYSNQAANYLTRAKQFIGSGDIAGAVERLNSALDINPNLTEAQNLLRGIEAIAQEPNIYFEKTSPRTFFQRKIEIILDGGSEVWRFDRGELVVPLALSLGWHNFQILIFNEKSAVFPVNFEDRYTKYKVFFDFKSGLFSNSVVCDIKRWNKYNEVLS